jgi:hypothetical protein
MTIAITQKHNNARLVGSLADLDVGVGNAAIRIYEGTRPASPDDTPTSVMLVQIGLTKPAGTVSGGLLTLTQAENGLIQNSGTATWARVVDGDGATCFDCDAGEGVGAWEIQLSQAVLYAGGEVALVSAVLG